jgi:hypothetical protein
VWGWENRNASTHCSAMHLNFDRCRQNERGYWSKLVDGDMDVCEFKTTVDNGIDDRLGNKKPTGIFSFKSSAESRKRSFLSWGLKQLLVVCQKQCSFKQLGRKDLVREEGLGLMTVSAVDQVKAVARFVRTRMNCF